MCSTIDHTTVDDDVVNDDDVDDDNDDDDNDDVLYMTTCNEVGSTLLYTTAEM